MNCHICKSKKEVRNINLYIIGSEGLNLCHSCEIDLITHIRNLISLKERIKLNSIKYRKEKS